MARLSWTFHLPGSAGRFFGSLSSLLLCSDPLSRDNFVWLMDPISSILVLSIEDIFKGFDCTVPALATLLYADLASPYRRSMVRRESYFLVSANHKELCVSIVRP